MRRKVRILVILATGALAVLVVVCWTHLVIVVVWRLSIHCTLAGIICYRNYTSDWYWAASVTPSAWDWGYQWHWPEVRWYPRTQYIFLPWWFFIVIWLIAVAITWRVTRKPKHEVRAFPMGTTADPNEEVKR